MTLMSGEEAAYGCDRVSDASPYDDECHGDENEDKSGDVSESELFAKYGDADYYCRDRLHGTENCSRSGADVADGHCGA